MKQLGEFRENLIKSTMNPRAADGKVIRSAGTLPVVLELGDERIQETVHILPGVRGILLSWDVTKRLRLIPTDFPRQMPSNNPRRYAPSGPEDGLLSYSRTPVPLPDRGTTARSCATMTPPGGQGSSCSPPMPSVGREDGEWQSDDSVKSSNRAPREDHPQLDAISGENHRDPLHDRMTQEFPEVFDGHIRTMPGEEFRIHLRDDAQPFCVTTPRRVPLSLRDKLEEELKRLETEGIIRRVTEPTEWCAPIVVAPKKDGRSIRLCVDLSHLNKYVKREVYQSPTPMEEVASIVASEARWFTVFDALKGYHQCPLSEDSQLLTTFVTPFGRYAYLRAPYGVTSISEHYNRRMDEAFEGMKGFRKIVDDVIIFSRSKEEHIQHVRLFLERCRERGISLNAQKLQLAKETVKFAGFIVSKEGYRPDPQLTKALSAFPTPKNITEVRSFFGLVNQVSTFVDDVAELLGPLRPLLSARNEFAWNEEHQRAFDAVRAALSSVPTLAFYDPSRPTSIETDASRLKGLGFVLYQQQPDGSRRVIQAGSRFLAECETRYTVIELELLAVAWAVKKCRLFLSGLQYQIVTDHRPLIAILNSKSLDEIENPRLQRLRLRVGEVGSFTATWRPGSMHKVADALSRAPAQGPQRGDDIGEDSSMPTVSSIVRMELQATKTDVRLEEVRRAAADDPEMQVLLTTVQQGFPLAKSITPEPVRKYWPVHDQLSVDDGLVVCGSRIVIPQKLRRTVLEALHASHLGKEKTKARARHIVFWPGIDRDVENITRSCPLCQRELPAQQKETMLRRKPATRPFEQLHMDFADHAGRKYLVAVDGFSGWLFVADLGPNAPAAKLISAVREIFCRVGVPDIIWSDGGPQFTSNAFQTFLRNWQVTHERSSPEYPQSNGKAESAVKAAKKLLRRCWCQRDQQLDPERWTRGILQLRNTPGPDGLSPAQLVYGRPVQDALPAHRRLFAASWQRASDAIEAAAAARREKIEQTFNQSARDLTELIVGSQVAVWEPRTRRWDRYGVVVEKQPYRRYLVRLSSGRVLARNRRHLRRRYGHAPPHCSLSTPTSTEPASPECGSPERRASTSPEALPTKNAPLTAPSRSPPTRLQTPPAPVELDAESGHPHQLPRRSRRPRHRPRRLIEEM